MDKSHDLECIELDTKRTSAFSDHKRAGEPKYKKRRQALYIVLAVLLLAAVLAGGLSQLHTTRSKNLSTPSTATSSNTTTSTNSSTGDDDDDDDIDTGTTLSLGNTRDVSAMTTVLSYAPVNVIAAASTLTKNITSVPTGNYQFNGTLQSTSGTTDNTDLVCGVTSIFSISLSHQGSQYLYGILNIEPVLSTNGTLAFGVSYDVAESEEEDVVDSTVPDYTVTQYFELLFDAQSLLKQGAITVYYNTSEVSSSSPPMECIYTDNL